MFDGIMGIIVLVVVGFVEGVYVGYDLCLEESFLLFFDVEGSE